MTNENPRGLPVAWGIPGMALVVTDAQKKLGQAPGATVALVLATDYAAIVAERDALRADAARLDWPAHESIHEGFVFDKLDIYDYACDVAEESGRDEPNDADLLTGYRRMIDAALAEKDRPANRRRPRPRPGANEMTDKTECRICGELTPACELKFNGGICDECDDGLVMDDDQSWGAHENG